MLRFFGLAADELNEHRDLPQKHRAWLGCI